MGAASEWYDSYKAKVDEALENEKLRAAISKATSRFSTAKETALEKLPYYPYLKKRAREIKSWSIDNLPQLINSVKENIEALGGVFYFAKDANDLNEYICRICLDHKAKLIVKSKSMTSEETFLNDALIERGMEVVETDLGERIIQLMGEKPSHIVVPAVHTSKEDIAALFSRIMGKSIPADASKLTIAAREMLREKFISADVGITGANAISADTGTIFLIENEGNARFVSNAPPVHICLAGVDKIVPTIEDAMIIVQLLPPSATGQLMSCYVSLITGPSRTSDIELTTTLGVHGPKELYLILLDNGRFKMIRDPDFKQASYCIRCGSCLNVCPVYQEIGGQVMGYRYVGGIGAVHTAFFHGLDKAAPFTFTCTGCGACMKACPLEIDVPTMIEKLRHKLVKSGYVAPPHAQIPKSIVKYNNPFNEPFEKRVAWIEK